MLVILKAIRSHQANRHCPVRVSYPLPHHSFPTFHHPSSPSFYIHFTFPLGLHLNFEITWMIFTASVSLHKLQGHTGPESTADIQSVHYNKLILALTLTLPLVRKRAVVIDKTSPRLMTNVKRW